MTEQPEAETVPESPTTETSTVAPQASWTAPIATVPVRATVRVPGSKSETARALVLAALADGPSTITGALDARDTRLMRAGLRTLGVEIDDDGDVWTVTPPAEFRAGGGIDCGLAGTVMRFLPPVAALAPGQTRFDGDPAARVRPMGGLLDGLADAGARIESAETDGGLPFTVTGRTDLPGGVITIDSSASSQFVSGLLLIGARLPGGLDLRHQSGDDAEVPSKPNIAMTVAALRERGVRVDDSRDDRWIVEPGTIAACDIAIAPDLANAAPFLAAAAVTGGRVSVPDWPDATDQPGDFITEVLGLFGADVQLDEDGLHVEGTDQLHAVDLDLKDASELTPVVAVLAALADHTSHLHGIAHIRGHETDRIAALATDLEAVGAGVAERHDGLSVHPKLLRSNTWQTFGDHRMAHAGAVLGLVIDDVVLDDIGCVDKTMPEFVRLWEQMLTDSVAAADRLDQLDEPAGTDSGGDTAGERAADPDADRGPDNLLDKITDKITPS